ncbi:hypothetical protein DNTS_031524 [Danionella cerebrum]|uniref:Uncharacterized protein n=1 Tax=Danionella cerebrum TaxID=2873325 RepID=A0A553R2Q7_9TELE|nr:hypothetical protein DNTS_031524 [Danionella translucida]
MDDLLQKRFTISCTKATDGSPSSFCRTPGELHAFAHCLTAAVGQTITQCATKVRFVHRWPLANSQFNPLPHHNPLQSRTPLNQIAHMSS